MLRRKKTDVGQEKKHATLKQVGLRRGLSMGWHPEISQESVHIRNDSSSKPRIKSSMPSATPTLIRPHSVHNPIGTQISKFTPSPIPRQTTGQQKQGGIDSKPSVLSDLSASKFRIVDVQKLKHQKILRAVDRHKIILGSLQAANKRLEQDLSSVTLSTYSLMKVYGLGYLFSQDGKFSIRTERHRASQALMELISSLDQQNYFSVVKISRDKSFSINLSKRGILRPSPNPKPFLIGEVNAEDMEDHPKRTAVYGPGDISPVRIKALDTSRARPSVFTVFNQYEHNVTSRSHHGTKTGRLNITLPSSRIRYVADNDLFDLGADHVADNFSYMFRKAYGKELDDEVYSKVQSQSGSRPATATHTARLSKKIIMSKIDSGRASTARTITPGQDVFLYESSPPTVAHLKTKLELVMTRSLNSFMISFVLLLAAKHLLTTESPADCLQYLVISLNLSLIFEDYAITMQVFKTLGDYFAKIRKFDVSLVMYTRGLQRAISSKDSAMQTVFFDLLGLTFFNLNQFQRAREFHQIMLSTLDHHRENERILHQNSAAIKTEYDEFLRYIKNSVPADPHWRYLGMSMLIRGHVKPWFFSTAGCSLETAAADTNMFLDTLVTELQDVVRQIQNEKLTFYLSGHNKDIAEINMLEQYRRKDHGGKTQTVSNNLRKAMHINKQVNKPFIDRKFTLAGEKEILASEELRRNGIKAGGRLEGEIPFQRTMLKTHESTNKLLAILLVDTNFEDPLFSHEKHQREHAIKKRQRQSMFELLSVAVHIMLQFRTD